MNKTEQKVLETLKNGFGLTSAEQEILANYIDKLQEENKNYKELILDIKGKLNNIQFEVEQSWRKIEKLESKYE